MKLPGWRVFSDADALVDRLAERLGEVAESAIMARGAFHMVLAGGGTPLELYRALAQRGVGNAQWHLWYGDERCLPIEHRDRNSRMIEMAWLAGSAIPAPNRAPIPAELGATEAATRYAAALRAVGAFDVVLLGMGEDGHTASLFPGHPQGSDPTSPDVLAVHNAPKPPPARVSLSAARLANSARVWFVITGSGKRNAVARWKAGEALPVAGIQGQQETVAWLDAAALPGADSRVGRD